VGRRTPSHVHDLVTCLPTSREELAIHRTLLLQAAKPLELIDAIQRAFPGYLGIVPQLHGPHAVTTVIVKADGEAVECRWSFGLSGRWSLVISGRTSSISG
jgi:hypothetical protein